MDQRQSPWRSHYFVLGTVIHLHPTPACLNELYFRQPLPYEGGSHVAESVDTQMWVRCLIFFFSFSSPRATCLSDFKSIVYEQGARGTYESLGGYWGCVCPACLLTRLCCPLVVAAFHSRITSQKGSRIISLLWNEFPMVNPPSLSWNMWIRPVF